MPSKNTKLKLRSMGKKKTNKSVSIPVARRIAAARPKKVRGKGGYFTDLFQKGAEKAYNVYSNLSEDGPRPGASTVNKIANQVGNTIGAPLGIGKYLGNAGSWLSRVLGFGKYTIKNNTLLHPKGQGMVEGMQGASAPPSFGSSKIGSDIVFSHREYVSDVFSSIDFVNTAYPINAGNPTIFPWMSQIAVLYEEFELLGLIFEYKSQSGTSNTSSTPGMGTVIMATDYDCYDSNYTSKRQMEAAEFSCSGVPYANFLHAIECDPSRNPLKRLYTFPGLSDIDQLPGDARFSVPAVFNIATTGQQDDGIAIGELWVTYHMRLSRPILESLNNTNYFTQHVTGTVSFTTAPAVDTDTVSNGIEFDITGLGLGSSASSMISISNATNGYVGRYQIFISVTSNGPAMISPASTTLTTTNVAIPNIGLAGTPAYYFSTSEGMGDNMVTVVCDFGVGGVIDIPISGPSTGFVEFEMYIIPMAPEGLLRKHFLKPRISKNLIKSSKNETSSSSYRSVKDPNINYSKKVTCTPVDIKESQIEKEQMLADEEAYLSYKESNNLTPQTLDISIDDYNEYLILKKKFPKLL